MIANLAAIVGGAVLSIASSQTVAGAASAQPKSTASFDCRRAGTRAEKKICSSPALMKVDREIAERYAALRKKLDPASAKSLAADQRNFLQMRDTAEFGRPDALTSALQSRSGFLNAINPGRVGILGRWSNLFSTIEIAPASAGGTQYRVNAVDPVAARWVCEASGSLTATGPARWTGTIADSAGKAITLSRVGTMLIVDDAQAGRDHCGLNGGIAGSYFPVSR